MKARFRGQVALITGASSGIGEGLARRLSQEGATLVLLARRSDRIANLVEEFKERGTEVLGLTCDVTRDGELERAVRDVETRFGRIDLVFANAGFSVSGPISELRLEDYRRQFETNVFGVLRTVLATLPLLKKSRGRLALLGSVAGHVTMPTLSPYSMSKFAIRALAESIHDELRSEGVTVTLISPGFVASEIRHVDNFGKLIEGSKDPVPSFLVLSTAKAVEEILDAVHRRKRERIVTGHGKLIVWIHRLFPQLFRLLASKAAVSSPSPSSSSKDRQ